MQHSSENPRADRLDSEGMKPIAPGYKRQWVRCKQCGNESYYDYVPYSFSNPVLVLPCKHGLSKRFEDVAEFIKEPTPTAIIYVDGKEFIRCQKGDNHVRLFNETVEHIGGEVALMVWKPSYNIFLREKMYMGASKA